MICHGLIHIRFDSNEKKLGCVFVCGRWTGLPLSGPKQRQQHQHSLKPVIVLPNPHPPIPPSPLILLFDVKYKNCDKKRQICFVSGLLLMFVYIIIVDFHSVGALVHVRAGYDATLRTWTVAVTPVACFTFVIHSIDSFSTVWAARYPLFNEGGSSMRNLFRGHSPRKYKIERERA